MKTSSLIASLLFIYSSAFGQDESCSSAVECTPCPSPCVPVQETVPMTPGYNAPARIAVNRCWDVFATGSFIYWCPSQENMELGVVSDNSNPDYSLYGDYVNLDFKYKPGFKVGLGMNLDRDNWDAYLEYTWFRGNHYASTSLDTSGTEVLHPAWLIPDASGAKYYNGKENWRLHMDLLDLELARHYHVGNHLSFRPFFGLRAAWIRQNIEVDYLGITPTYLIRDHVDLKQKSHSWAIGPRIGLSSNWELAKSFRMYGDGSVDALFTQYTNLGFRQQATNNTGTLIAGSVYSVRQKDLNYVRAHLDLELGFGWGTYFACNKWHVDITAGYGFQVFFDQNMFRSFLDDQALGKSLAPNGNLYIHGLTLTARLDF